MRKLHPEERQLLIGLSRGRSIENMVMSAVANAYVKDLPDGGMRSVQFVSQVKTSRRFGCEALEGTFMDEDGVPVSVSINLDQDGDLYKIDMFKADNSPLIRYPTPESVALSY